jgi:hypothetical protein
MKVVARKRELLEARVIRIPLRERDLTSYFAKKALEYGKYPDRYRGLLDERAQRFLERYGISLVPRRTLMGQTIARRWEEEIESNAIIDKAKLLVGTRRLDEVRRIPTIIQEDGLAVTWTAIEDALTRSGTSVTPDFRYLLQHIYFKAYVEEYDLRVLGGLPFERVTFGVAPADHQYDYECLQQALRAAGLWDLVMSLDAASLIDLRYRAGYTDFRRKFALVAELAARPSEVREVFVGAADRARLRVAQHILRRIPVKYPVRGIELTAAEMNDVDECLAAVAACVFAPSELIDGSSKVEAIGRRRDFAPVTINIDRVEVQMPKYEFHGPVSASYIGDRGTVVIGSVSYNAAELRREIALVAEELDRSGKPVEASAVREAADAKDQAGLLRALAKGGSIVGDVAKRVGASLIAEVLKEALKLGSP